MIRVLDQQQQASFSSLAQCTCSRDRASSIYGHLRLMEDPDRSHSSRISIPHNAWVASYYLQLFAIIGDPSLVQLLKSPGCPESSSPPLESLHIGGSHVTRASFCYLGHDIYGLSNLSFGFKDFWHSLRRRLASLLLLRPVVLPWHGPGQSQLHLRHHHACFSPIVLVKRNGRTREPCHCSKEILLLSAMG